MRTTITIEPDVAQKLKKAMEEKKITLKEAVNRALRLGLDTAEPHRRAKFKVEPHACGFRAGIDTDKLNQLVDELEAESTARKLADDHSRR